MQARKDGRRQTKGNLVTKGRKKDGRFAAGNRIWEARASCGPNPKFANGDDLWAACVEYFDWNEANPLYEAKLVSYQGISTIEQVPRMRAMTIGGLCLFIGISHRQWIEWKQSRADLVHIVTCVEEIIRRQKFEGAASEFFNANIIARDLGLADKSEFSGPDGGPIKTETTTLNDIELARRVAFLLQRGIQGGNDGQSGSEQE